MCSHLSGMRPEAQLSDSMICHVKTVWKDIWQAHAFISGALDIGREALP